MYKRARVRDDERQVFEVIFGSQILSCCSQLRHVLRTLLCQPSLPSRSTCNRDRRKVVSFLNSFHETEIEEECITSRAGNPIPCYVNVQVSLEAVDEADVSLSFHTTLVDRGGIYIRIECMDCSCLLRFHLRHAFFSPWISLFCNWARSRTFMVA